MKSLAEALDRAKAYAPYLRMLAERQPDLAELLMSDNINAALQWSAGAGNSASSVRQALRREKSALALTLAVGDLAGQLSLDDVIRRLSDFADQALDRALADSVEQRTPDQLPQGFAIIGLGKHGSRELNYSSDIDPIFIYDPATIPMRGREEPADAARKIGQALVEALSARDGDGYVFRVDMRLRPSPEVSPIALPVEAAIGYYESSALTWEQSAFIRARVVAGDRALGQYFLDAIRPFVWRRSLDYGAVRNIADVTRQIRDHYAAGQAFGPGFDLKRGRGGIREAEFFAQMHQLVFGGREPALRVPDTRGALSALAKAGRIAVDEAETLGQAYALYRTIEHRLQMVNDQQTHSLPAKAEELDRVARLHGLSGGSDLLDLLAPHVEAVGALYDGLIAQSADSQTIPREAKTLAAHIAGLGFLDGDAEAVAGRVARWRKGELRVLRSDAAQHAFEAILPKLLAMFAAASDPIVSINRFDSLIERLPSAVNFFRLLEARPGLLDLLGSILSHAPTLADMLARRAELFDGLIDATALDLPPDTETLAAQFAETDGNDDYQLLLDQVRARVNERRFALGTQLIMAAHDPLDIAAGYARVAEAAIAVLAKATIAEFAETHGRIADSELVILALGRLGGESLTHASDLDLIFLFTGDHLAESDGRRPLGATQYYNRLAQRIVAALSVATAAGPLYEVDTRLRPSGNQGLLAVTIDSFLRYQHEEAWTWEHMALTRARPVYGSQEACAELKDGICEVLKAEREPEELRKAVRKMRLDIVANKPPKGPLDVKLMEGGLVDWEFIVHFLQLRDGTALHPQLGRAVDALVEKGLLAPEMASDWRMMTRLLVALRLISPDCDYPPEPSRALIARAAGMTDWDALLSAYEKARHGVIAEWNRLVRTVWHETYGDEK